VHLNILRGHALVVNAGVVPSLAVGVNHTGMPNITTADFIFKTPVKKATNFRGILFD
jgi:hypothetical protein